MQAGETRQNPEASVEEGDALPLMAMDVDLADHLGRRRHGRAVLLSHWPAKAAVPAEDEDFRIVLLSEPPEGPIAPAGGVVVSAPARRLTAFGTKAAETATPYEAANFTSLKLPPKDLELLRQGRLFAATPLEHSPEEVFEGKTANLTLLARDVLAAEAMSEHLRRIAMALAAPAAAKPSTRERLDELRTLIDDVRAIEMNGETAEVGEALDRLAEVVTAEGSEQFLATVARTYPAEAKLMEDVYALRALRERREAARELFASRRFLQQAVIPAEEADLAMDRSLVLEQLNPVAFVTEPEKVTAALAALDSFRRKYAKRYRAHHTAVWQEIARLHMELVEARSHADALRRVNSLAELGPPLGVGALAAFDELLAETSGCELINGVDEIVKTDAVCPACGITLADPAPTQRVRDVLRRVDKACEKQLARLSSTTVQHILEDSANPLIEQFLRVVQASQLSDLTEIMDERLAGYLRRFLVESRIRVALDPILDELQQGNAPSVDEAKAAMRDVTQTLQKAFEATQRALPAPEAAEPERPRRGRRKR